ncbi:MAG: hypothetical protein IPI81_15700 [Flavobacteriales bacterium]|nr:hypothetical protein [Flavobacteriales bacterium]MCC6936592.1 hypothetical protein [Flavobacteriales bacterium]
MKQMILVLLVLLIGPYVVGQDRVRHDALIKEAWGLYEKKEFRESAASYSAAFQALGWKGSSNDRYNAACSYALAGVPDSAFFHLDRIASLMDYANVQHITTDVDLNTLHNDPRWPRLIGVVKANKERIEADYDKPLVALLDSVFDEDQGLRRQIEKVETGSGRDSKEMQALWDRMAQADSTNLVIVTRILDERGWLGPDVIGQTGNSTLFLVIQHADLVTQEKYLPMMREAVTKGNAKGSSLALLEDRVLIRNGKQQRYGSQIGRDPGTGAYFLSPLEDPDNVDVRRAAVGLGPIADYIARWELIWDVEAYKKELPALEERIKARKP